MAKPSTVRRASIPQSERTVAGEQKNDTQTAPLTATQPHVDSVFVPRSVASGMRRNRTLITIAADPKHLGARIGILSVLHTWGSALTHHPHVYVIVPGGGISLDGERWIASRPGFFLPVRVLSRLFRRLVLEKLGAAHCAGQLQFFGTHAALTNAQVFAAYLAPLRNRDWVVYSKRPFGGPAEVLHYLARYTRRYLQPPPGRAQ
jgi:hypothetical protein